MQTILVELLSLLLLAGAIGLESLLLALPFAALAGRLKSCPREAELPFLLVCAGGMPALVAFVVFWVQGRCTLVVLPFAAAIALAGWLFTYRECLALLKRQWRPLLFLGLIYGTWVAHQALLRSCSGPFWYGDWHLHYSMARYFYQGAESLPPRMLGRTWLCSLFGSFYLAQWPQGGFRVFQLCIPFLALAAAAAGGQLAALLFRGGRSLRWLFWLVFPFIPSFTQNACYTWPKLFMAGCLLTYLLVRLVSIRQDEGRLRGMALAGVCAAVGFLAHASTLPYVLATETALAVYQRRRPLEVLKHWAVLSIAIVLVLSIYYVWLASLYDGDEILGGLAISRGASFEQQLEQAWSAFKSSLLPYEFVKSKFLPPELSSPYKRLQGILRIACDSFLGLVGPLGWVLFFGSLLRTRLSWEYARFWEERPFTTFFMALGGGGLCLLFHAGLDNKGMMSIAFQPVAIVLLGLICAQFHRDSRIFQGCAIGVILLYGAILRSVSILYLRNGVLLDRNYYFLQKENGITLWYDHLSAVSQWIVVGGLLACLVAMVVLAMRWQRPEGEASTQAEED